MRGVLAALAGLLLAVATAGAQSGPVLHVPPTIEGSPVLAALAPDAIRAIDAPRFLAGEAARGQMADGEMVLGVHLGGETRAYPLGFLSSHEIVNDRFGDTPVVVTW